MDTYLSYSLVSFFLRWNLKNVHPSYVMADGRFDGRRRTSDVRRQPQPWQVDAIENHGGAIGFPLAMVFFFKFQSGRSLTDITVRTNPSAFKLKLNLAYFITSVKKSMFFFTSSKIDRLTMAARRQGLVPQQNRLAESPNSTSKITNIVRFYFKQLLS